MSLSWVWFWGSYLLAVAFGAGFGVVVAGLMFAAKNQPRERPSGCDIPNCWCRDGVEVGS